MLAGVEDASKQVRFGADGDVHLVCPKRQRIESPQEVARFPKRRQDDEERNGPEQPSDSVD